MGMVDGAGLIEVNGCLFTPDSALLPRLRWATAQIEASGGSLVWNEAGRPYGVSGDANVRSSSQTASGRSTVWYQWGRYLRGETPSAANPAGGPYASEHTQGIAIDCNANPTSLRARFFAQVGLSNTIASESWHWAIRGGIASGVDLASYAGGNSTPIDNRTDDDEMLSTEAQEYINRKFEDLRQTVLRSDDTIVYGWDKTGTREGDIAAFGTAWHESGVGEPDRTGLPGRYVFPNAQEYLNYKGIFDAARAAGQPAAYLPDFANIVWLDLNGWVLINKIYQTPVDEKTGEIQS